MNRHAANGLVFVLFALFTSARAPLASSDVERSIPLSGSEAADVARITCAKDGISIETPLVRAHPDGVHLWFENPGEAWGVTLHPETWARGTSEGVKLTDEATSSTSSMPPGNVTVACLERRLSSDLDPEVSTATFTVVDPDGSFVPWDPACGFGQQSRIRIPAGQEDPAEAFRRVPGVRASDGLRTPLYPGSPQYWPTFLVYREGTAVARIMGPKVGDEWKLLVNACPGSEILGA